MSGTRSGRKAHHSGPRYAKGSALVRAAANATPGAVCWRCGKTLDQHRTRTGKPDTWQAGHTQQGSRTWQLWLDVTRVPPPGDWLAPEARSCNAAAANHARGSAFDW